MKTIAWVIVYPLWCVLRFVALIALIPFWLIIMLMECIAPDFNRMRKALSRHPERSEGVTERGDRKEGTDENDGIEDR